MSEPSTPSTSESGRLVRKERLGNRLRDAPHAWLMRIQEDWETLDWESIQEALSWPAAIAMNGFFLFLRLSHALDPPESQLELMRSTGRYTNTAGWLHPTTIFWRSVAEMTLACISIVNTLYLFTRTRRYQLFDSKAELGLCARLTRALLYPVRRLFGRAATNEERIWELFMWDPPLFSLNLFCWFSPPQVAIYFALNSGTLYICVPMTYYLSRTYIQHVRDKQLLFSQVYAEYNSKFVNPIIQFSAREQKKEEADSEETLELDRQGRAISQQKMATPKRATTARGANARRQVSMHSEDELPAPAATNLSTPDKDAVDTPVPAPRTPATRRRRRA
ncbi:hypothetical protein THASP1DRAFT_21972 [Thamnocephalis sphaerospora]|uniref:Uncharacterized protein n=1 Tax=Thamnocephalis sphaerospora TaxID=78915 RepID=A0A4P9XVJ6_9FUNG|nr:hypothetical protein THASP1DRAFT_21972 [Thamnocephalis sphaerospora]|eukprot:RKP10278.1 hypothetical protein THASP1DRAFT_21972 [Thamnocephalis sphaerospora]